MGLRLVEREDFILQFQRGGIRRFHPFFRNPIPRDSVDLLYPIQVLLTFRRVARTFEK